MAAVTSPSAEKLVTGEELWEMGDIGLCELIDGRIVPMSPAGNEHGFVEFNLGAELRNFVRPRQLGWVSGGEVGIYIRRNPDRVRGADITFVSKEKLPAPTAGFLEVAPDLVVEIISPHDRWQEIRDKIVDYFSIGVEQVWIIEPASRTVLIHRSPTDMEELSEVEVLKGEGVLAGFEIKVADLFAG